MTTKPITVDNSQLIDDLIAVLRSHGYTVEIPPAPVSDKIFDGDGADPYTLAAIEGGDR